MRLIHSRFPKLDTFSKNIILVFCGAFFAGFLNLLYQLLIAHRFSPPDFAEFNALLSLLTLVSAPFITLQTAVAKYTAEFNAHNQVGKVKGLLSNLLRKTGILSVAAIIFFSFTSSYIADKLKIHSPYSGYIVAIVIASLCITPVVLGAVQGLERFIWFTSASVIPGVLKLILAFIFILLGFNIAGALGALLISNLSIIVIALMSLRPILSSPADQEINYQELFWYLFPVAASTFCFMAMVNMDMLLVKYFFTPVEAGSYALAQMVGKIFLFLPMAIGIVMFPRTSILTAKEMDANPILKRSLLYASTLSLLAVLTYNLFPAFILKVMTGKAFAEPIFLGRLFSISMTFFSLLYILITYFLSLKDLRFIKYLFLFTCLQFIGIAIFHQSLTQVQLVLGLNSLLLFILYLILAYKKTER